MKKLFSLLPVFVLFQMGFAQQATIVENTQKSQYENTSYLIVGSLVLKPGFSFNSSTQGSFFARAYENDPEKSPFGG
jgi:hypothetical protein